MNRRMQSLAAWLTLGSMLFTGCAPTRPFYLFEDGDMSHYRGVATEIEYPDAEVLRLDEVEHAEAPLTVANNEPREFWELSLEEAIKNALANSKVMRNSGGRLIQAGGLSAGGLNSGLLSSVNSTEQLLASPATLATVYTPALAESNPLMGSSQAGVEAALAAFDAQFYSTLYWNRNDRPINLTPNLAIFARTNLAQDLGTYLTQVSKVSAVGTQYILRNNITYEYNNNPSNLFPSVWNNIVEAEFRHPLLQGAGVDFNRIAGPQRQVPGQGVGDTGYNYTPGNYSGVAVARINTDVALADFEANVRNLVYDTETAYWNLYQAYRTLDANVAGRDSALTTWRKVYTEAKFGKAAAAAEAQAREQYFLFRSRVEDSLSNLYQAESQLRFAMGLAATDGRLIRPNEEPTTVKMSFDWNEIHTEALARSAELRRQRWIVKRRELELAASKNYLLPRLDAVGVYRWRGFGNDLINSTWQPDQFNNATQNLLTGNYQEWQAGFNLAMPLGFRLALTGVRNAQLQLARDRSVLQEQELAVSHLLAESVRSLDRDYMLAQTRFNRRAAAKRRVEAVQQTFEVGTVTVDQLLEAQRLLAEAESEYFGSLTAYNRDIMFIHFRKGSLLEYNGVMLAEGPWASKAYYDATDNARKRDAGLFLNYGFTRPQVFSQGPIEQMQHGDGGIPFEGQMIQDDESLPVVPQPSDVLPATPSGPSVPTPAPPMPEEAKPTRFEQASTLQPGVRPADAFATSRGGLQQSVSQVSYEAPSVEGPAANEGRQGRSFTGTDRAPAIGSRR